MWSLKYWKVYIRVILKLAGSIIVSFHFLFSLSKREIKIQTFRILETIFIMTFVFTLFVLSLIVCIR